MFEMNFSNPAFLGYVNECEEDYHRSKLDQIVETFKNYNLGLYDLSLYYVNKALDFDNNNERLLKNRDIIVEKNNNWRKVRR